MTTIANNIQQVLGRIQQACASAGRDSANVKLLAVSKTFDAAAVQEAVDAGQTAFGENYVQEGVDKILALRGSRPGVALQWHCIGPLQSNKTRPVAEHFDWVHTVDRLKIAERLSAQRPADMPDLNICLQVNVDGGANKSGVPPQELLALAQAVAKLPRLRVRGLLSIPEPQADAAAQLMVHQQARVLMEGLQAQNIPGLEQLDTLSLGMTADLEAAVAAGSTLVRVGTGIFGGRTYPSA